ncbi:MAG: DUF4416 family protein [Aquificaceae bacterium]|nr:DUF4416 family protein [Aquificaceae bacterium]
MKEALAKAIMSLLYKKRELLQEFLSNLPVERLSEPFYFQSLQRYYGREMGEGLHKVFLSFRGFMRREELKEFKKWALEKERYFSIEGKRGLNIDPGYVEESHLILASSKRRGGRFYLGEGIYAEIEYLYVYGAFRPLYWTYGDYRDIRVREFFERVREDFLKDLKLAREGKELVVYRFTKYELYQSIEPWRPVGEEEVKS